MKTSNAIMSVVAGAAVGALIGVLFAPDKGANTRGRLTRKGEDLVGELKGKVDYYKGKAVDMVDQFADKIHSQKDRMLQNGKSTISSAERQV